MQVSAKDVSIFISEVSNKTELIFIIIDKDRKKNTHFTEATSASSEADALILTQEISVVELASQLQHSVTKKLYHTEIFLFVKTCM